MKKQPKTYEQNYVFQPNYECDVQGYPKKKKKTYNNITKMRQDSITQLRTTQKKLIKFSADIIAFFWKKGKTLGR